MKVLLALSSYTNKVVEAVVFALLAVLVLVISACVFWRYVLNDSLSWGEELGRYLLVWISFLGASMATYRGAHIGIGVVVDRLPAKLRRPLAMLVDVCMAAFLATLVYQGIKILPVMEVRSAPTLPIRMDVVYAVMPIAAAVMLLHVVADLGRTVLAPGENP